MKVDPRCTYVDFAELDEAVLIVGHDENKAYQRRMILPLALGLFKK